MEIRNEMQDFMIHVPTQIFFGRSAIDHLAESIEKWSPKMRVLLVYGGGSIKRMGLFQKFVKIFEDNGIFWTELAGVQPNPKMGLIREGVKICKENDIDCVLAAGGGSAVDTAKAVATAVKYDGDIDELQNVLLDYNGVQLGLKIADHTLLLCVTETISKDELDEVILTCKAYTEGEDEDE